MPDNEAANRSAEATLVTCEKCAGGGLEHLTRLPRGFDHPTFDIFRCVACGFVSWIERDG